MESHISEGLVGVVIGGLLSGLGTWITLAIQHRRWTTEMRVSRLQAKRDKLEATSTRVLAELWKGMANNFYSSNMLSDIDFLFPEPVLKSFNVMMADKENHKDTLKMQYHYYDIARTMKKALKDIDDQIDAVVLGKKQA